MEEILLHQYDRSPFSEKIRKIFAWKKIAWRSVDQPIVAPKPKLTPLTGGYRKIPVLQIGADIYCDTALIARVLEERHPQPSCFPGGNVGACEIVAQWADHWLFMAAVPPALAKIVHALPPEFMPQFMKDREAMSPGFTIANMTAALPDCRSRLVAATDWLESQIQGRDFFFGSDFSVADAACFHVLWFLRNDPESFAGVESQPALRRWFERIEAMGNGVVTPLDPDDALDIARRSLPLTPDSGDPKDPNGLAPGDRVSIVPDDYGVEVVTGVLVRTSPRDIAIRREDSSVGEVVVHFPRVGYRVTRC